VAFVDNAARLTGADAETNGHSVDDERPIACARRSRFTHMALPIPPPMRSAARPFVPVPPWQSTRTLCTY